MQKSYAWPQIFQFVNARRARYVHGVPGARSAAGRERGSSHAGSHDPAPADRQHCASERARSAGGSGGMAEPGETFATGSFRQREVSPLARPA